MEVPAALSLVVSRSPPGIGSAPDALDTRPRRIPASGRFIVEGESAMTPQAETALEVESRNLRFPPVRERMPAPGSRECEAGQPDDEATWPLWRGLFIGSALSVCVFWGPLALLTWWWFR